MKPIQPLKDHWKIEEDKGYVPDQIKERVNSEDWYTHCKGYPLVKEVEKIKSSVLAFKP